MLVHLYVPQLIDAWIGQVVVAPEQNDAGENAVPLHDAGAHIAVELRQSPAPSQTFVLPQAVVPPAQVVSVVPAAFGAQLPAPLRLHA